MPETRPVDLWRFQQAAIQRLNEHIGRMALADYEFWRESIQEAKDREAVDDWLHEATGERVKR